MTDEPINWRTGDGHKVEVYEASDGWRWRTRARNGEIVASGEAYSRLTDAFDTALDLFPRAEETPEVPS